jgi:hypothetical protein
MSYPWMEGPHLQHDDGLDHQFYVIVGLVEKEEQVASDRVRRTR